MEEQKSGDKLNTQAPAPQATRESPGTVATEAGSPEGDRPILEAGPPLETRGRMIRAGLIATVILSGIAVLVAGIFQLTSRWLIPCPTDLPVNDPAPILWNALIADKVSRASLGVPKGVAVEVRLKDFPSAGSAEHTR